MGKLIYDKREGYDFISDNGVRYNLLEGKSLGGKTTSDIVYIHLDYDSDFLEKVTNIDEFVGWFYGATMVADYRYREEFTEQIKTFTTKYEEKHPEIVEYYNPKKKYRVEIERVITEYVDVEAKSEDEAIDIAQSGGNGNRRTQEEWDIRVKEAM